jgi:hypothetical protein
MKSPKGQAFTTLVCPVCEKEFKIQRGQITRRLKQMKRLSGGTTLYCSKECGGASKRGKGYGSAARVVRQPGWTLERWKWEKLLAKLGLGMAQGLSRLLDYGWEPFDDSVKLHNYVRDRK